MRPPRCPSSSGRRSTSPCPKLQLVPIGEVPEIFGGPETLVAAVYNRLLGDLCGSILLAAPRASSLALVDLLRNRPPGTTKSFGRGEQALITHIAAYWRRRTWRPSAGSPT